MLLLMYERGRGGLLPRICYTYPTMRKFRTVMPNLKEIQQCINHVTQLLSSADIGIFSPEIRSFRHIGKYRQKLHLDTFFLILLTFIASLQVVLIKMNAISIMFKSAKLTTRGLLKIKVPRSKGHMNQIIL